MARILLACESDFFRFSRAVRLPMCSRVPVSPLHPALFVLSEGVLRERTTSPLAPVSLDEQALLAGALDGLRLLARLDLPVIVLAGMAGTLPNDSSPSCHDASVSPYQLRAALRARGLHVDAVHSYPLPSAEDRLHRRSALPRTLRRIARLHAVDLTASVLICDTWADAAIALSAGCQPILVMTGAGREQIEMPQPAILRDRTWYAADLAMAALTAEVALPGGRSIETVA